MDDLLIKLSEQQAILEKQKTALASGETTSKSDQTDSNSGSALWTPATEDSNQTRSSNDNVDTHDTIIRNENSEMDRLKKELDMAKSKIAQQEQELSHARVSPNTGVQASVDSIGASVSEVGIGHQTLQDNFSVPHTMVCGQEDARSDISEAYSVGTFNDRSANIWANPTAPVFNGTLSSTTNTWGQGGGRSWTTRLMGPPLPALMGSQPQPIRNFSQQTSPILGAQRLVNDFSQFQGGNAARRPNIHASRNGSTFGQSRNNIWEPYTGSGESVPIIGVNPSPYQQMGMLQASVGYQSRAVGNSLSPTATEFSGSSAGPWNSTVCSPLHGSFLDPTNILSSPHHLARRISLPWSL